VSYLAHVVQLPKTFCCHEGVLDCSGLMELWMGSSASMGKSKAVSSHRSPRNTVRLSTRIGPGLPGIGEALKSHFMLKILLSSFSLRNLG
jgi:hypothetical protein